MNRYWLIGFVLTCVYVVILDMSTDNGAEQQAVECIFATSNLATTDPANGQIVIRNCVKSIRLTTISATRHKGFQVKVLDADAAADNDSIC